MIRRAPIVTLLLAVAAAAAFAAGQPGAWVFDRGAILEGEIWRMVTGHWVHFSPSHLWGDLLVFTVGGALMEAQSRARFAAFCVGAPALTSLVLLIAEPGLEFYGGLSAVAVGIYAALATGGRFGRTASGFIFLAIGLKIGWELAAPGFAFAAFGNSEIVPCVMGHAAGAIFGAVFQLLGGSNASFKRPEERDGGLVEVTGERSFERI